MSPCPRHISCRDETSRRHRRPRTQSEITQRNTEIKRHESCNPLSETLHLAKNGGHGRESGLSDSEKGKAHIARISGVVQGWQGIEGTCRGDTWAVDGCGAGRLWVPLAVASHNGRRRPQNLGGLDRLWGLRAPKKRAERFRLSPQPPPPRGSGCRLAAHWLHRQVAALRCSSRTPGRAGRGKTCVGARNEEGGTKG